MRQAYLGRIYSRISGLELSPTTVPNDKGTTPYLTYRFPLEFVSWYYFLITYNTGDIVFKQTSLHSSPVILHLPDLYSSI